MPQTSADAPLEEPIWSETPDGSERHPTFVSPLYERLEANLPKDIMHHSDAEFPEECQLFASRQSTLEYLQRCAKDSLDLRIEPFGLTSHDQLEHLIKFETQVLRLEPKKCKDRVAWHITSRTLGSGQQSKDIYDAVVLASGHFTVPFVPDIPGVKEWADKYPESMTHSKFFRTPEDYTNKRTITVGRGSSGIDIAAQIALYCAPPLHISTRTPDPLPIDAEYTQHPEISSFDPSTRTVRFTDGTSEADIDAVLFCTGYLYAYPFLPRSSLDTVFPDHPISTPDGARPHNLYKYIFYAADPTLAFLSMPQQIVPFPVVDNQAAVVARAWAGRLDLPDLEEMRVWEERTVREKGEGKKWLWLKPPEDGAYLNGLADFAEKARAGEAVEGALPLSSSLTVDALAVNGTSSGAAGGPEKMLVNGKSVARWGEKEVWMRQRIFDMKRAFAALGEGRHQVRTLEELGFDYEKWKRKGGEL